MTIFYTSDKNTKVVKYKYEDIKIIYQLTTSPYQYIFKI